ncbi:MAG: PD40 domain-containing protein [Bacteroidetes bacterium]|nr:PD40 domain-containing protein [Bacteroidota bacterium]
MPRYFLFVWFVIITTLALHGQGEPHTTSGKALKHYNLGKQYYDFLDYGKAVDELKEAIRLDDGFIEAHLMLAEVCVDLKDYPVAINSFKRAVAIDPKFFPNALYNLAHIEHLSGIYNDAKDNYQAFLDQGMGSKKRIILAMKGIKNCEFALKALRDPVPFNPVNLGKNVNSEYDEYWPSLTADEKTLIFTVLLTGEMKPDLMGISRQEDFYVSKYEDGSWAKREDLGSPLNTSQNEGAQFLSVDGKYMFFTACNRKEGHGSCDIYFSAKINNRWSVAMNIGTPVNSRYWEAQPCLSADGNILYFISNRPGGKGKMDIWKSSWNDKGYWNNPVNLGDTINTSGNEMSPYIHPDNQTLYFSSDGFPGMGGFDLFRVQKQENGTWNKVENLGYPINTHGDEIGLIVNAKGDKAYFSSDRLSESGKDIYEFELYKEARPQPVSYMTGKVFDIETGKPLTAKFELIDIKSADVVMEAFSGKDGNFLVCIPTNKDYALNVSKEGFLFFSEHFSLSGIHEAVNPYHRDVPMSPIIAGQKAILRNVFFEYNSFRLRDESLTELNKLVEFLNLNSGVVMEIGGHTDNIGDEAYNKTLSENRAKAVYEYLIDNQIDEKRLLYKGYGMTQPIDDNSTPEGRTRNRRTEMKVIGGETN